MGQMGQMANILTERQQGSLPSNLEEKKPRVMVGNMLRLSH